MSGPKEPNPPAKGQFLVYQTEDGQVKIDVRLEGETAWLTQAHLAELFQTTVPNVNMHLRNVYAEGELQPAATVKEFLIVRQEGSRQVSRAVEHYNLDAIISVGYRVKSAVAMREWIAKLNAFLTVNERAILEHAGKISTSWPGNLPRRNTRSSTANRFNKPTKPGAISTRPSNTCRHRPSGKKEARSETRTSHSRCNSPPSPFSAGRRARAPQQPLLFVCR